MHGTYDVRLVVLSYLIACFSAFIAFELATRLYSSKGSNRYFWLIGGAISMGTGIWSMHFIGMLSFMLPIAMGYDPGITLLSMIIAIIASAIALYLLNRSHLSFVDIFFAGTLMGIGIAAMHYTGMAAMEMLPAITYDPILFFASIFIAIGASTVALSITYRLRDEIYSWQLFLTRFGNALIMGIAIAGMHYTGMAAAQFAPNSISMAANDLDSKWLAVLVSTTTFGILLITLIISIFDSHINARTKDLATSLKQANRELQYLALHDKLTELPNRTLLGYRVTAAIDNALHKQILMAIIFLDVDRFKHVNDAYGHQTGDMLLQDISQRIQQCVRMEDTVSRLGGDEFVVVLRSISSPQDAAKVCQNIQDALESVFQLGIHKLHVTSSMGISIYPHHGTDTDTLLKYADTAMYRAKSMGRNNYQFYAESMSTSGEYLKIENGLRNALKKEHLDVRYQPKIDIGDGRIIGMEALLCWEDPEQGTILPKKFIHIAEHSGLIIPIGKWVLDKACKQTVDWINNDMQPMRVAVNISAIQFLQKDLPDTIDSVLNETGLNPEFLEIELTESALMENPQEARHILEMIHETGVTISIDDFGTGYSSLSQLRHYPADILKIDLSFIAHIHDNPQDLAVVTAIIQMAHSLKLRVIAEGVENLEQLQILQSLGCDEYQGYLSSRPLTAERFSEFVKNHSV